MFLSLNCFTIDKFLSLCHVCPSFLENHIIYYTLKIIKIKIITHPLLKNWLLEGKNSIISKGDRYEKNILFLDIDGTLYDYRNNQIPSAIHALELASKQLKL